MLYLSGIGRYKGLDAKTAFLTFVEQVEDQIASENAAALNVMTVAAAAEGAKGSPPPPGK